MIPPAAHIDIGTTNVERHKPARTTATEEWNANISVGAWVTGGNLNTNKYSNSGAGTQIAALTFGGLNRAASNIAATEQYNGTSWAEVNDMNTARQSLASVGHTSTAALAVAGGTPPVTNNLNANNEIISTDKLYETTSHRIYQYESI